MPIDGLQRVTQHAETQRPGTATKYLADYCDIKTSGPTPVTLVPTPRGYSVAKSPGMTQTNESSEPPAATAQPSVDDRSGRPSRVDQIWSVVAIAAGVVFIVTVIFFWGFFLGRATDGPNGGQRASGGAGDSSCPMMGSGGGMRPGTMGPGGSMEPHQSATPTPQPTTHP